jgi:hypothetical protein
MTCPAALRRPRLLLIPLLLASCGLDWNPSDWDGETGGGGIEVSTELFGTTGIGNEWRFYTNDGENALPFGKSFWYPVGDGQEPFGGWSLVVTKDGGEAYAGYGMIFCHGSDGNEESMLTVMLRCDGYFQVAEVIGTDYRPFDDWLPDDAIVEGYGRDNEIAVDRDSFGTFILRINGVEVYQFTDDEEPFHSGGDQGLLAVASPLEDFPDFPVSIRYRIP